MTKPKGIIPAMVTPFTDAQSVDEDALARLVDRFLAVGVDGIFALGTNGEFFSLSFEEKVRIATLVVSRVNGRVPVYAGTGAVSTQETVELSKRMESIGVDALSVITPYFLPLDQDDLRRHFEIVSESVTIPILLYNIPARTGVTLQPKTVSDLSKIENIVGIKDSSGNFEAIVEYINETDDSFSVLCGTDSLVLWGLEAGASGAIASTANLVPEIGLDIYRFHQHQDNGEALRRQLELNKVRSALQIGGSPPIALKAAMNLFGFEVGPPRLPLQPLDARGVEQLRSALSPYIQTGPKSVDGRKSK